MAENTDHNHALIHKECFQMCLPPFAVFNCEVYLVQKAAGPTPLGPRKRKKVNYAQSPANQKALAKAKEGDKLSGEDTNGQDDDNEYSGSDSASESSGSEAEEAGQQLPEGAAESSRVSLASSCPLASCKIFLECCRFTHQCCNPTST